MISKSNKPFRKYHYLPLPQKSIYSSSTVNYIIIFVNSHLLPKIQLFSNTSTSILKQITTRNFFLKMYAANLLIQIQHNLNLNPQTISEKNHTRKRSLSNSQISPVKKSETMYRQLNHPIIVRLASIRRIDR